MPQKSVKAGCSSMNRSMYQSIDQDQCKSNYIVQQKMNRESQAADENCILNGQRKNGPKDRLFHEAQKTTSALISQDLTCVCAHELSRHSNIDWGSKTLEQRNKLPRCRHPSGRMGQLVSLLPSDVMAENCSWKNSPCIIPPTISNCVNDEIQPTFLQNCHHTMWGMQQKWPSANNFDMNTIFCSKCSQCGERASPCDNIASINIDENEEYGKNDDNEFEGCGSNVVDSAENTTEHSDEYQLFYIEI